MTGSARRSAIVVDDDADVRTLIRLLLERENWTVHGAADAVEALRLIDEHSDVGVLVSDVNMPLTSGLDLAASAHQRRPHLKVLYITGHPDFVLPDQAASRQDEAYLQKPFTAKALYEALSRLVLGTHFNPSPG